MDSNIVQQYMVFIGYAQSDAAEEKPVSAYDYLDSYEPSRSWDIVMGVLTILEDGLEALHERLRPKHNVQPVRLPITE